MTVSLNLFQRLLAVQADIDGVEKGGTNESQGYKFVRAADVAHTARKALLKHGVYVSTSISARRDVNLIERPNKSPILYAEVFGTMTFVNIDAPDERITQDIVGHGMAYGEDKGIYKAITGAIKYGLRAAFLIPDELDPEATHIEADEDAQSVERPAVLGARAVERPESVKRLATDRQRAHLRALGREKGLTTDALFKAFVASLTGKTSSKDLELKDYDKVLATLNDNPEYVAMFDGSSILAPEAD